MPAGGGGEGVLGPMMFFLFPQHYWIHTLVFVVAFSSIHSSSPFHHHPFLKTNRNFQRQIFVFLGHLETNGL